MTIMTHCTCHNDCDSEYNCECDYGVLICRYLWPGNITMTMSRYMIMTMTIYRYMTMTMSV